MLWFQAHTGIALYILSRRHFRTMPFSKRLLYGTFGSLLFNYGSCLFWALGRSYLPRIPAVHVAFGLMSGGILLYIGQDYFHYIDNSCSEVDWLYFLQFSLSISMQLFYSIVDLHFFFCQICWNIFKPPQHFFSSNTLSTTVIL